MLPKLPCFLPCCSRKKKLWKVFFFFLFRWNYEKEINSSFELKHSRLRNRIEKKWAQNDEVFRGTYFHFPRHSEFNRSNSVLLQCLMISASHSTGAEMWRWWKQNAKIITQKWDAMHSILIDFFDLALSRRSTDGIWISLQLRFKTNGGLRMKIMQNAFWLFAAHCWPLRLSRLFSIDRF